MTFVFVPAATNHRSLPKTSRGFSIVELMVAMMLSLLLLSGVISVFVSSRASYETTDRLSRIQENGRFALDQVVRDIRSAGFPGCARVPTDVVTSLNSSTDLKWNFLDGPVRGYQYTGPGAYSPTLDTTNIPSVSASTNSDVLVVRRPEREAQPLRLQADMTSGTADLIVPNTTSSGLDANDIAMVYNCQAQAYFQVSTFSGGTITHTTGGSPGNSSNDIVVPFPANSEVIPVETVIYYIRPSTTAVGAAPSLWRRIGGNAPEELVEGVEQMQLRFGIDTNGDATVDSYQTANAVTDWKRVYSVEVALLVRSLDEYGADKDTEAYQLLDVAVPAINDRRMREIFTTTVGIRNLIRVN